MDDCWLRAPALYVGEIDDNIDLNLPAATGEEYIKQVVIEAQRCDSVVVAEIDESRLKQPTVNVKTLPGCKEAPVSRVPSLQWQECQIADFSDVRLKIARWKIEKEKDPKKYANLSPQLLPEIHDQSGWENVFAKAVEPESTPPSLSTLMSMSHPLIEQVLEYIVEYLEEEDKISNKLGEWIYALLAVIEQPLTPESCYSLRALARICSVMRANPTSNLENRELNILNLFICLVARYFRQHDLADS